MSTVHVLPINDLIEHEDAGGDCACGPTVEPVFADDGYCGWLVTHHSLEERDVDHRGWIVGTERETA